MNINVFLISYVWLRQVKLDYNVTNVCVCVCVCVCMTTIQNKTTHIKNHLQ